MAFSLSSLLLVSLYSTEFPVKKSNDYVEISQGEKVTFHISVLATDDVYLFLSEDKDTTKSKTYWFILDGWKGSSKLRSVIRKCGSGVRSNGHAELGSACAKEQKTYSVCNYLSYCE
jgi:hypothetical protein